MNNIQFKDRLIAAREHAGLSQSQLARQLDMAPTQLARYESGRAVPRRKVMERLALALAVNSRWLAEGNEPPDAPEVLTDKQADGGVTLTFRPDPETAELWRELAARSSMSPDDLFGWVLREMTAQIRDNPTLSMEELYADIHRRLQRLESRVNVSSGNAPPAEAESQPAKKPPASKKG